MPGILTPGAGSSYCPTRAQMLKKGAERMAAQKKAPKPTLAKGQIELKMATARKAAAHNAKIPLTTGNEPAIPRQ